MNSAVLYISVWSVEIVLPTLMENILMNSKNKNELKCMQKVKVNRYYTIEEEKRFKNISNKK
ncbi:hypothetical protein JCM16161A_24630 [Vulcanisaeta sp. JCM 16161]